MSGSVKLKIKLKPRPAEGQSIPDSSGRKLDDSARDPPGNKGLGASSTSEIHKHKKLKQAQASSGTPGAVPQSNKVKLHIKGPWGKATSTSGNNDSPLRSSSSVVQPSSAQHRGSVVAGSKPPAKQAPDTGRQTHILSAKPPSKKKRQHSFTASGFRPHTANGAASFAKHGTQSLDTKSEDTNMESVSGRPGTTLGHAVKADEAITSAEGIQPTRAVLERIVDKMQRKDTFNIFKEPVTEAMAPGYFQVVKRGMDFFTMRSKVQANGYSAWQDFQDDMDVMFDNAMAYNQPDTVYHKQARSLKAVAAKMVDLAKQGVTDFRGKTMQESKAHNAQIAAEEQAHREARRLEQRNAMAASRALESSGKSVGDGSVATEGSLLTQPKHAPRVHRPIVRESDMRKFATQEENTRATYWQNPSSQHYSRWKGLVAGASAEGAAFHSGRPILRAAVLLGKDTYAASIARFTSGLKGSFKQLAKAKIANFTFPAGPSYAQAAPVAQTAVQQPAAPLASNVASLPYTAPAVNLPQSLSGFGPGRPAVNSSVGNSSASVANTHSFQPGLLQAHSANMQTNPARTALPPATFS